MSYATLDALKTYLGIALAETGDDALLTTLLDAATSWIEQHTGRVFAADANTIRRLDATCDADGQALYLDVELCQLDSITDASGSVTLGDVTPVPRNSTPWYALKRDAGWSGEVVISGRWAWSLTPPPVIVQATKRLAAYLYHQKDAQVFDVTAEPGLGTLTIPKGMPIDVQQMLATFVRLV